MASGRNMGGRPYRRNRALLLAASDLCALCGHHGAQTADHIIPDRAWPRDDNGRRMPGFDDLTNLQPAHGTMGNRQPPNPCPVCGRLCNQVKGDGRRPARPAATVQGSATPQPRSRDWYQEQQP